MPGNVSQALLSAASAYAAAPGPKFDTGLSGACQVP